VAETVRVELTRPCFLFQAVAAQAGSGNMHGEILWQPGLFEGGASPSEQKSP